MTAYSRSFAVDEVIVRENSIDDGLYIILHGQIRISIESQKVELLGPGSVIGEMMVLSGLPRTATATAETPVTALWISSVKMRQLMKESESLTDEIWPFACTRFAENILSKEEPYHEWHKRELRQWIESGVIVRPDKTGKIDLSNSIGILLNGEAITTEGVKLVYPSLLLEGVNYRFSPDTRVFVREKKLLS